MDYSTNNRPPVQWPPLETPQQHLLKELFRTSLLTGVLVLIIFAVTNAGSLLLQFVSMSQGLSFLSEGMNTFLSSYAVCILGDLIAIGAGLLLFHQQLPKTGWFGRPQAETKFLWLSVFGILGAASIGVQILNTFYLPFYYAGFEMSQSLITIPRDDLLAAVFVGLYICIIGPILEEILFRGIILRALEPYGAMTAIIVSALMFTIFHFNPLQLFTPLLMGVMAAFIALRSQSLWPVILAHILNNTLAMLPEFFFDPSTPAYTALSNLLSELTTLAGIIVLLVFAYCYGKQFTRLAHEEPRVTGVSIGAKLKKVIVNPITIVLIVFYLITSVVLVLFLFV